MAGGGTAGHVEPALNLADVLRGRHPDAEITFLGTRNGLEARLVPARGYELDVIEARPLPRRMTRRILSVPAGTIRAVRQARTVIEARRIDVAVGFGSYVALPAYLAARGRAAIVVHEANARAGLANRIGARLTPFVAQAYDGSIRRARTLGIPLRPDIARLNRAVDRGPARARLGLDPEMPCLLVFGGSQGARRINAAVVAAAPNLIQAGLQILHGYGAGNLDQVEPLLSRVQSHYVAQPYFDPISDAYSAADLAVCRAGALTCAELAAVGLPAIYIPFAIGNGEQRWNAAPVVDAGGGLVIDDGDVGVTRLTSEIAMILAEPGRLSRMGVAAKAFGVRDGGERLADMVEDALAARTASGKRTGGRE